mgnify:CR=1 FL=1
MSALDMSMFNNRKYIDTLNIYKTKIESEKGTTCEEQENKLYDGFDDTKRILLELGIIKRKLEDNDELYVRYNEYYQEIVSFFKVVSLTKTIIPQIKQMIVLLDIACGLRVHLYSAIPSLLEIYKEEYANEFERAYC